MLGKCGSCGGVVSSHAERCPRCGANNPYSVPAPPPVPPPPASSRNEAHEKSSSSQEKSGTSRWLMGLLTLILAIVVGGISKFGVQQLLRPPSETQQIANSTDAEIVARMDRVLGDLPNNEYLSRMETTFPEEYQQFVEGFVPIIRNSASSTEEQQSAQAFAYAQTYMRAFIGRQHAYIAKSDPEIIGQWLAAQVNSLTALRSANVQACAQVVEFGEVQAQTGLATYPDISDLLQRQVLLVFDMIESGRRAPHEHAPMADADWQHLYDVMLSQGADAAAVNTLGSPDFALLSDASKCDLGLSIYQAAATEPDPALRARIGVALFTGN